MAIAHDLESQPDAVKTARWHQWRGGLAPEPKDSSTAELKKVGVTIINEAEFWLQCDWCGQWWPGKTAAGQRSPDYWKCPDGCNAA